MPPVDSPVKKITNSSGRAKREMLCIEQNDLADQDIPT